ncbi:MAG: amidase family protein [Planctomycetota bacterium]
MTSSDARDADATSIAESCARGERSVESVVADAIARAEADPFGAMAEVRAELALERARELDRRRAAGEAPGPLHGVPFAIKANLCARGFETHCGSRLLAGWRAPYDATSVERLLAAGAVPRTTHMDEFGMGSSGENSAYEVPRNPRDSGRTCGGSSSGSASAVASGVVPFALGSDTGGSVRQPAAFCGVFGLKPTWGRVSRHGLVAFASSLDTVGVLARSARDLERVLAAASGADGRDATATTTRFEPRAELDGLDGITFGVPTFARGDGLRGDVASAFDAALERLAGLGARLVDVEIPQAEHAVATYYVVATAEASSNLARFDGVRYGERVDGDGTLDGMYAATRTHGFGDEVVRRVLLGTHVLSSGFYEAWFDRAARVRRLLSDGFDRAFATVDAVVSPTAPTRAFELGSVPDPLELYRGDALTIPASLAGLPAVSAPCDVEGLPVGLQIVAPRGADALAIALARAFAPGSVPAAEVVR